ncbi:MAG: creatininase family protein [bacterium]
MKMCMRHIALLFLVCGCCLSTLLSQKKVRDLKFHALQEYSWMRLAEVVPEVTDRVILPIGTVESHGVCAIGTDNYIPENFANMLWDKCNALIAPAINHGTTGTSISQFPGSITVRPEIMEEYLYDVIKHLIRTGFKNILIINGHGGNTDPLKKAMSRLHLETGAHMLTVDWWKIGFNTVNEVYGGKPQQSGHGDLEEAALVLSFRPELIDKEMYEKLGKDNVGRAGVEDGFFMLPSWATSRLPEKDFGYMDFDVNKAKSYTQKKADSIADIFLEAVNRWEMMERWKK